MSDNTVSLQWMRSSLKGPLSSALSLPPSLSPFLLPFSSSLLPPFQPPVPIRWFCVHYGPTPGCLPSHCLLPSGGSPPSLSSLAPSGLPHPCCHLFLLTPPFSNPPEQQASGRVFFISGLYLATLHGPMESIMRAISVHGPLPGHQGDCLVLMKTPNS